MPHGLIAEFDRHSGPTLNLDDVLNVSLYIHTSSTSRTIRMSVVAYHALVPSSNCVHHYGPQESGYDPEDRDWLA